MPSRRAPNFLLRIMALFNRDVRGMLPYLGKTVSYDVTATLKTLGWEPTPMERSFLDMAAHIAP